jgi:hypothetical protein
VLLVRAQNMMRRTNAEFWKLLHNEIRAERARETGMWLISADVTGQRDDQRIGYGPTSVISPQANVIAQVPLMTVGLVTAEVGPDPQVSGTVVNPTPGPPATHHQDHAEDDRCSDSNAKSSPHQDADLGQRSAAYDLDMQRLALFDLGNTLVNRSAAFQAWAQEFVITHRLDDAALTWLLETDARTSGTKGPFFRAVRDTFHLDQDADDLWQQYRRPELLCELLVTALIIRNSQPDATRLAVRLPGKAATTPNTDHDPPNPPGKCGRLAARLSGATWRGRGQQA